MRILLALGLLLTMAATADAGSGADSVNLFSVHAATEGPVASIKTTFNAGAGKAVRITIYDSEENFLQSPRAKREGLLDADGFAIVSLNDLEPGEYSLAAYLDLNGDGKLNRGSILGRPKEPVAFSNGFKPKLRKPRFDETKVSIDHDSVVVITLDE